MRHALASSLLFSALIVGLTVVSAIPGSAEVSSPALLVTTAVNPAGQLPERRLHLASVDTTLLAGFDVAGGVASPDGSTIAWIEEVRTASYEPEAFGAVYLFDLGTATRIRVPVPALSGHVSNVDRPSLAFNADGSVLGATTSDGVVEIDVATGDFALRPDTAPGDLLLDLGDRTALITRPGEEIGVDLIMLRQTSPSVRVSTPDRFGHLLRGAISPDGTAIAITDLVTSTGFAQETVMIGTVDGLVSQQSFDCCGQYGRVNDLVWAPDSSRLAVGRIGRGTLGEVQARAIETLTVDGAVEPITEGADRVAGWTDDGSGLVVAVTTAGGTSIQTLDLTSGAQMAVGQVANLLDVRVLPGTSLAGDALATLATDPVADALYWSAGLTESRTDIVLVARADDFPDALASGVLQGTLDAPLLLTDGASLEPRVADEITRLGATHAILLGGTAALEPQVATDLEVRGVRTERIAGPTRIDTAVAIAEHLDGPTPTALLLRAGAGPDDPTQAWADSIAAGAFAATQHLSILLTDSNQLSSATATRLRDGQVEEVLVIGGSAAVSDGVVDEVERMGMRVRRIAGEDRVETAAAVAVAARDLPTTDDVPGPSAVVDGSGAAAWAGGFAASLHVSTARGHGLFLVTGDDVPDATLLGLRAADPTSNAAVRIRCGQRVEPLRCAEMYQSMRTE